MDISKFGGAKQTKRSKWQAYIDDALLKTGQVKSAAIHGLDGLKWACSKNFQVSLICSLFNLHNVIPYTLILINDDINNVYQ